MNIYLACQTFISYFAIKRHKISARKLEKICKSENLDEFLGIDNTYHLKPEIMVHYATTHGFRRLHLNRPELNQFIVAKKGNGFSKARNLPYIYLQTKCKPPQLIVESPSAEATSYGYAQAASLPCITAGKIDEYPEGALVVCLTEDNKESADYGYANALPLPYSRDSVYVQKIDMLDTEYVAMLVDEPRF
jgi:hypothetical protein